MGENKYWKTHLFVHVLYSRVLWDLFTPKIDLARNGKKKSPKDLLLLYVLSYVLSYSIHADPASLGIYLVHGQLQSFQLLPFPTILVVSSLQHVYFVELVKAERS